MTHYCVIRCPLLVMFSSLNPQFPRAPAEMSRFVRSSKYRHVFGTPNKRDQCYDNIRITKSPNESNMCCVNSKYVAVVLEQQGGGAFQVMRLDRVSHYRYVEMWLICL